MQFSKITALAVVVGYLLWALLGTHVHADLQVGDVSQTNETKNLFVSGTLGKHAQTVQVRPVIQNALLTQIQSQFNNPLNGPFTGAAIVVTPTGEIRYLGTVKNPKYAGTSPGPNGWRNKPAAPDDEDGTLPVQGATGARAQTVRLNSDMTNAFLADTQAQLGGHPIINAVIIITPAGELRYMGTLQDTQNAGPGPGPGGWWHSEDIQEDESNPNQNSNREYQHNDGAGPGPGGKVKN